MAGLVAILLFLPTAWPLWHAWQANRSWSLLAAVNWALSAWTVWGLVLLALATPGSPFVPVLRYLALCVTGCAGVAVLGARRPGVTAWNFVVVGLLAVLLLPVVEGALRGSGLNLDAFRYVFLSAMVAVGVLNYLPTRLAAAALLTLLGCAHEVWRLIEAAPLAGAREVAVTGLWLVLVPWTGWVAVRGQAPPASEFDQIWLGFRDRFGLVWGQRLREQFNRSAAHAGWPVILRWQGLRLRPGAALPDLQTQTAMVATLRALLKRFGPEPGEEPAA
jgi:hypothetical protein